MGVRAGEVIGVSEDVMPLEISGQAEGWFSGGELVTKVAVPGQVPRNGSRWDCMGLGGASGVGDLGVKAAVVSEVGFVDDLLW
jgi:hypothetical protein